MLSGADRGLQHLLLRRTPGVTGLGNMNCTICICECGVYSGGGAKPFDAEMDSISTLMDTDVNQQTVRQVVEGPARCSLMPIFT